MAGIHGKNAEIRISTSQTAISGLELTEIANTEQFQIQSGSRDWKYGDDIEILLYIEGGSDVTYVDKQTRTINYAAGAIETGPFGDIASGVMVGGFSMELTTVANLVGDARSFTISVSTDTVDTTTIGETWKGFADGLAGWEGSLDGLYIDEFWYKQAIATLSGVIPQRVMRFIPDPAASNTYFQGTCIFPSWEISGGFDSAIEHSVPFQGRGPLDAIIGGNPFFNLAEVF